MNVSEGTVDSPEILEVDPKAKSAACDGGGGALGHPLVYLSFSDKEYVDCYYCGRRFVRIPAAKEPAG